MTNILIVEDNPHFRSTLKNMLGSRFPSSRVNEARSAEKALDAVMEHPQDLVLMDIHLPGMSGIEAARKIKQHCPECMVIMLTGYDTPEYRDAAFKAGADGFLSKRNTTPAEVLEQVEAHLKG